MAARNTDINLIIRARTEGEKLVESLSGALNGLFGNAQHASGGVEELGRTVDLLNKAFGTINSKADQAEAAFNRQKSAIASTKAELAGLQQQYEAAGAAIARLQSAEGGNSAGGDERRLSQIKGAQQAQADLSVSIARLTQQLGRQEAALNGSASSLQRLGSTAIAIKEAQTLAAERFDATTAAINRQAAAAEKAAALQERINSVTGVTGTRATDAGATYSALTGLNKQLDNNEAKRAYDMFEARARQGAAELRANEKAAADEAAEIQRLKDSLNPAAAAQRKFNAELEQQRKWLAAGKISADEFAQSQQRLTREWVTTLARINGVGGSGAAGSGGNGKPFSGSSPKLLFGLKPYELTNLGYQVNDVITQLASGTSLAQTLAQQGGQILQLFPRVGSAIIAAFSNPVFLAAAATIALIADGIKHAADQAERLRHYTGELSFRADGGAYNAAGLATQEHALETLGHTSEEARDALKTFLDAGVAPDRIDRFAASADNLSHILGNKLADSAKMLADGFTGGYKAVAELDDKLNFLTATEREHIRTLFDEGKANQARTEAYAILEKKADEVAAKQRGTWSDAGRSLEQSWNHLVDSLANTWWANVALDALDRFARGIDNIAASMRGAKAARDGLNEGVPIDLETHNAALKKRGEKPWTKEDAEAQGFRVMTPEEVRAAAAQSGDTRTNDANAAEAKRQADQVQQITFENELQHLRDAGQQRLLTKREQARREELAGIVAARAVEGDLVKAAERTKAIAHERAEIEKESDARRKQAEAERERAIRQFEQRVVGAEGGTAKNPHSSAKGFGQFTEGTFLDVYRRTPGLDQSLGRDQILALRENERIAKAVIDQFARDNARALEKAGQVVSAGNLYLMHFLGQGGALSVLRANPNTPVNQIIRDPAVLSGNKGYLRTDNGRGRYRTAGELKTFIANRVGDTGQAQSEAVAEQQRIAQSNIDRQENLNLAIRHEAEDHQRTIDALKAENGLRDTALLAEQRKQAVAAAELELRQKAEDANKNLQPGEAPVVVTDEQVAKAKELAGALFDAQKARELLDAGIAEKARPVQELQEQISQLQEEADALRALGDNAGADAIDKQVVAIEERLRPAIDDLIEAYQALTPAEMATLGLTQQALDIIIRTLKLLKLRTQEWGKVAGVSAQDIARAFASAATQSIMHFLEKVGQGKNVFKSLAESVAEFAASFIQSIAQMIIQLLAFAAAVSILRALGVPVPSGAFMSAGGHHMGGTVGGGGSRRTAPAALFAGAMRFHTGGIIGLQPDEMPIIAKRGEEVLTQSDPRHRMNGGLSPSGPGGDLYIIEVPDHAAALERALRTPAGSRTLIRHVSENKAAFKQALS